MILDIIRKYSALALYLHRAKLFVARAIFMMPDYMFKFRYSYNFARAVEYKTCFICGCNYCADVQDVDTSNDDDTSNISVIEPTSISPTSHSTHNEMRVSKMHRNVLEHDFAEGNSSLHKGNSSLHKGNSSLHKGNSSLHKGNSSLGTSTEYNAGTNHTNYKTSPTTVKLRMLLRSAIIDQCQHRINFTNRMRFFIYLFGDIKQFIELSTLARVINLQEFTIYIDGQIVTRRANKHNLYETIEQTNTDTIVYPLDKVRFDGGMYPYKPAMATIDESLLKFNPFQ